MVGTVEQVARQLITSVLSVLVVELVVMSVVLVHIIMWQGLYSSVLLQYK